MHDFDAIIPKRPIFDSILMLACADLSCFEEVGFKDIASRSFGVDWLVVDNLVKSKRNTYMITWLKVRILFRVKFGFNLFRVLLSINIGLYPEIRFFVLRLEFHIFRQTSLAVT